MEGYYDVDKMTKKGDRIQYNHHITITQIPKKAFDYVVNGKMGDRTLSKDYG